MYLRAAAWRNEPVDPDRFAIQRFRFFLCFVIRFQRSQSVGERDCGAGDFLQANASR